MVKPNRKTRASTLNRWQQKCIAPPANKVWARLYLDTFDSEPWRDLTINARRVLDALICHHFRHAQQENGKLEISYSGFQRAGVSNRDYVGPSIEALIDAGILNITGESIPSRRYGILPKTYEIAMYRDATSAGYIQKANRAFIWIPVEVLESPAWCGMSINEHRMLDRMLIENIRHRSEHNGRLRVSYQQFEGIGIGHRLIAPAAKGLVASGFLAITKGRRGKGVLKPPNLYRLTFLGTVDAPATWRQREPRNGKETVAMQANKNFSLVPKGDPALVPKGDLYKTPYIVPKGDLSSRFLVYSAAPAQAEQKRKVARTQQVEAYALAHRNFRVKLGLPTHAEANLLRRCYGIGETNAAEWAIIASIIAPADPRPEAAYRAVNSDGFWRILDQDGAEIPLGVIDKDATPLPGYDDRSDAWRHVDRLREAAGIIPKWQSPVIMEMPASRLHEPRQYRGH